MTFDECVNKYQYDVSIDYLRNYPHNVIKEDGWYWEINGGYSSVSAANPCDSPNLALFELVKFLETFNGFEK